MKKAGKRVIPAFGISMGVTLSMVSLIVIIPLASLVIFTSHMSFFRNMGNHYKRKSSCKL